RHRAEHCTSTELRQLLGGKVVRELLAFEQGGQCCGNRRVRLPFQPDLSRSGQRADQVDPPPLRVHVREVVAGVAAARLLPLQRRDRKSTRLNSSHVKISYAVFCLKKKNNDRTKQSYRTPYR